MSRDQNLNTEPIEDDAQMLDFFRAGEKPPARFGVGTEHEKFVFRRDNCKMVSFEEPGGLGDIFQAFVTKLGWIPTYDESGSLVAVEKDGRAITLEPGGQFELSGAVCKTIFETESEFDEHIEILKQISGDRLYYTALGLNPIYSPDEIPWMPKTRYKIMGDYLPTRGDLALWMMKATCTVQANFDYASEDDAVQTMRTALLVSPLVSALFASSPIKEGTPNGMQSYRGYLWTRTDPDRTGFPAFMYADDWGYRDYLNYVLDVPMFFIRREQGYINMAGHSFRQFLKEGYGPYRATMGDFELHLSTVFPEVRMKQYIEVRGADAGPRETILALPALWKGLLYHPPSRAAAASLMEGITPEDHRELFFTAYRDGIHAHTPHGSILELAEELLRLSKAGLETLAQQYGHPSEARFLEPLTKIIDNKTSIADQLLADFGSEPDYLCKLTERWSL